MTEINPNLAAFLASVWRFNQLRLAKLVFRFKGNEPNQSRLYSRRAFGANLVCDVQRGSTQQLLFLDGERFIAERHLVRALLKPGMHVVDVGANIGYYAALARQCVGDTGHISCFEPSEDNLTQLRMNIEANGWNNVIVFPCAAGATNFKAGLRDGINSGVVPLGEGPHQTDVVPLDDTLLSKKVNAIKIDVEGYEWDVLEGAKNIIARDKPLLFIEVHPILLRQHGRSASDVLAFLRDRYQDITFHDIPEKRNLLHKFLCRYDLADPVRTVSIDAIPDDDLHLGRYQGTFWAVCRPN